MYYSFLILKMISFVLFPPILLPSLNFNTMYIENGHLLSSTQHTQHSIIIINTQFVLTFHRLTQDFVLICIPALIVSTRTSVLLLLTEVFCILFTSILQLYLLCQKPFLRGLHNKLLHFIIQTQVFYWKIYHS